MVTIAAENFMVGALDGTLFGYDDRRHRPGDVASLVEVGLARKAEEIATGDLSHALTVFSLTYVRVCIIKAESSLGRDNRKASVSSVHCILQPRDESKRKRTA